MAKRKAPKGKTTVVTLDNLSSELGKAFDQAERDPDSLEGATETMGNPITLGPRVPEADAMAEKLVTNAEAAAERWLANVQKPKRNPVEAAKAANTKYKNKLQEALREDRYLKGLDKVDVDEMMQVIVARGSAAYSSGIRARAAKVTRVFAELRPLVVALTAKLDAMPTDTSEQREAKMIAAKRGMEEIGKRRRGIR